MEKKAPVYVINYKGFSEQARLESQSMQVGCDREAGVGDGVKGEC